MSLKRSYQLNLPQILWEGLNENWLLKELGDIHWEQISNTLGTPSAKIKDENGNRLYAKFVRLSWSRSFTNHKLENDTIKLNSKLSKYGNKMFFSETRGKSHKISINAELMTVFSTQMNEDGNPLKTSKTTTIVDPNITIHKKLPIFAKEYLNKKSQLFKQEEPPYKNIAQNSLFHKRYKVDAYDDINGVGILYFASYPKIVDKCERTYIQSTYPLEKDWIEVAHTISRDVHYYGNANSDETVIYVLESLTEINGIVKLVSSIFRERDKTLIAKIFTEKKLLEGFSLKNISAKPITRIKNIPNTSKEIKKVKNISSTKTIGKTQLNHIITDFIQSWLDLEEVKPDDKLKDLGLESIGFIELSSHLKTEHKIDNNPSWFFSAESIEDISTYLLNQISDSSSKQRIISKDHSAVAIIGMSCRFPGVNNPNQFWEAIKTNKDLITSIPKNRSTLSSKPYPSNKGGFIDGIENFDASFFGISPIEAEQMDPQQRITLESVYAAIEDAGIRPADIKGKEVGVFIGVSGSDYTHLLRDLGKEELNAHFTTGGATALLANRISYFFDLRGASQVIDTACSSSLVAVHEALQYLNNGKSELAIVGGVNAILSPDLTNAYHKAGMLSKDGACKTFDQNANGYVRSEGVGVIILRKLKYAINDQAHIYGIIKGSAINHGGKTSGITVPNPKAQKELLIKAYSISKVNPREVGYIETHGTGTPLGDPIEIEGIKSAFQTIYQQNGLKITDAPYCGLGSVKTNIGHLEAAAGIAGLIKVLLCIKNQTLPGNPHLAQQNKYINLENTPFYLCKETSKWKNPNNSPRIAGVSSFGIGGVNAHLVLEEFLKIKTKFTSKEPVLILLSAKTNIALKQKVIDLIYFLKENDQVNLFDMAYTLHFGRAFFSKRLAIITSDINKLIQQLEAYINKSDNKPDFIFTHTIADSQNKNHSREDVKNVTIKDYTSSKGLKNIAQQWVNGTPIDWRQLYKKPYLPQKISLPTYPFAKHRYWFSIDDTNSKQLNVNKENIKLTTTPEVQIYEPKWIPMDIQFATEHSTTHELVILAGTKFGKLRANLLNTKNRSIFEIRTKKAIQFHETIITIIKKEITKKGINNLWIIYPNEQKRNYSFISGLLNTAILEFPNLKTKLIGIDAKLIDSDEKLKDLLTKEKLVPNRVIRYSSKSREVLNLNKIEPEFQNDKNLIKPNAVYLISGGSGALGQLFAQHLSKLEGVQLILIGSSENCGIAKKELKKLNAIYYSCDIIQKKEVKRLIKLILKNYGKIDGIIHSVATTDNRLIINETANTLRSVMLPKTLGATNLDEATHKLDLDFFVCFSSISSIIGLKGASNYASANAWLDTFIAKRKILVRQGKRKGKSISINWPSWEGVGLELGNANKQFLLDNYGMSSLPIQTGLNFFNRIVNSDLTQCIIYYGTRSFDDCFVQLTRPDVYEFKAKLPIQKKYAVYKIPKIEISPWSSNFDIPDAFEEIYLYSVLKIFMDFGINNLIKDGNYSFRSLGILEKYDPLCTKLLEWLKGNKYLNISEKEIKIPKKIKKEVKLFNLEEKLNLLNKKENSGYIPLLQVCLNSFKEILQGKKTATEVIFPNGRLDLVANVYKGNPKADFFNKELGKIVHSILLENLSKLQKGEKFTILEIGAGTGGTSQILIDVLTEFNDSIKYIYTDISNQFLFYAEDHLKPIAPYLSTKLFNIEYPPEKQGIELASCDLIIGTNVVHATSEIANSLCNIKSALKPNGILLLNELEKVEIFNLLTFGLLDGWWLAKDKHIRVKGSPILTKENWKNALSNTRFKNIAIFPKKEILPHQIIIGQKDEKYKNYNNKKINYQSSNVNQLVNLRSLPKQKNNLSQKDVQILLKEILSKTIKLPVEHIETNLTFNEMGLDSILGNQFIGNINNHLGIQLSPTEIYNFPKIDSLTQFIIQNFNVKQSIKKDTRIEENNMATPTFHNEIKENSSYQAKKTEGINIAIVGMSGEYGKVRNLNELWEVIKDGQSLIEEVPNERWDINEHYSNDKTATNKSYSKWGSFLRGIDEFDPLFFRISGTEAKNMDPHQRLFLMHCWKAIEDAAIIPNSLNGKKCGVYVGAEQSDYLEFTDIKDGARLMGGSNSILAARIAYFLNLKGPAIAIDTACSSSLVAIEMACKSLQSKEIDVAISGGVSINITPAFYKMASKVGMLSEDGQCFTFDSRANGFVPGEGVGVLVLKRLEDAELAGDPIYGVIKGIGINQDGTTNGITAPSSTSQEELELEIYEKYQINPSNIEYVEAHGTGTKLGDPIEFEALTRAFNQSTKNKQFCALGSIKTNIGHTRAAAGVAGVQKIVLCLKHKIIPPLVNFEKVNPLLDENNSPFYFNKQVKPWTKKGTQLRQAAASSFGFSGTNAHIVIEEYPLQSSVDKSNNPAIIIFSADTQEQLMQQVKNLVEFLSKNEEIQLIDLAYTLQIGRKAMEKRLAFIAKNKEDLENKLNKYVHKKLINIIPNNLEEDASSIINKQNLSEFIKEDKLEHLIQLWLNGTTVDWSLLYEQGGYPKKLNLPTYPFLREKYWLPTAESPIGLRKTKKLSQLVHFNLSTPTQPKFKSIFNGQEPFLADHKINGTIVFPGVAYLEMARAAGKFAFNTNVTQLKEITWISPILLDTIEISLFIRFKTENQYHSFEIYSFKEEKEVIHVQGKLEFFTPVIAPSIDISSINSKLKLNQSHEDFYQILYSLNFNLGKSFRGIQHLQYNEVEVLSSISSNSDSLSLIGILDSALQSCIGTQLKLNKLNQTVPFNLKTLTIYSDIRQSKYAYISKNISNNNRKNTNNYDIYLLKKSGEVIVHFQRFIPLPTNNSLTFKESKNIASLFYSKEWKITPLQPSQIYRDVVHYVILANGSINLAEALTSRLDIQVKVINSISEIDFYLNLQKFIQKLNKKIRTNLIVIYPNIEFVYHGFIIGLLKTTNIEHPKFTAKTIGTERLSLDQLNNIEQLIELEKKDSSWEVRYHKDFREVSVIQPLADLSSINSNPYIKKGGTYLITGGAGGLGKLFHNHISETEDTKIIIIGRRDKTDISQELLKAGNTHYYKCDLTIKTDVIKLIKEIKLIHNYINGIFHCAGIIKDTLLVNKTAESSTEVLNPKIIGTKNLELAIKDLPIDFIVYSSSIAGVMGNQGQADYASANAWLDHYAKYLNELQKERNIRRLSINWPLWEAGGMQMSIDQQKFLDKTYGLLPLPTLDGLKILDYLMGGETTQVIVAFGRQKKIDNLFLSKSSDNFQLKNYSKRKKGKNIIQTSYLEDQLRTLLSQSLEINPKRIDTKTEFSRLGLDSIIMIEALSKIESHFNTILEPTALINYSNLQELTAYIKETLDKEGEIDTNNQILFNKTNDIEQSSVENDTIQKKKSGKIAIIGMSCKLPESNNFEEFWEFLKNGYELIREVPTNRWNTLKTESEISNSNRPYTTKGGYVKDIGLFDAAYFNIKEDDAIAMDPQQRIMLELSRALFAHAGYTKEEIYGSNTGIFIGAKDNNYFRNNAHLFPKQSLKNTIVNNASNMIAARVSDFYNFKGISTIIDTACSSSLVAIHNAYEALREGKVGLAIAGGISLTVDSFQHTGFSNAQVLSKDGKSYIFDERAQGFVIGEGGALVLLKSYNKAIEDGDQILATISASAVNNDGQTMGVTVPNQEGQKQVIEQALSSCQINPREITYYEAHGTGTLLGDPIEIKAATEAYRSLSEKEYNYQYCALGSVKSNVGHTMTAAGVTGLIKILLQIQHKMLVPTLNCEKPHPRFNFETSPFYPNTELKPWKVENGKRRIAAISSFGFGGTNAHMIIEEAKNNHPIKRSLPIEYANPKIFWPSQYIKKEDSFNLLRKEVYNSSEPYVLGHIIDKTPVLLGVTYISLLIDSCKKDNENLVLGEILFKNSAQFKNNNKITLDIYSNSIENLEIRLNTGSVPANKDILATGRLLTNTHFKEKEVLKDTISIIKQTPEKLVSKDELFPSKTWYQGEIRIIEKIYIKSKKALSEIKLDLSKLPEHDYKYVHPVILNAGLVTGLAIAGEVADDFQALFIKKIQISKIVGSECLIFAELVKFTEEIIEVNFSICDNNGTILSSIEGFVNKRKKRSPLTNNGFKQTPLQNTKQNNKHAEKLLRTQLSKILNTDTELPSDKKFMELGLDSIQLVNLVKELEKETGKELYPTLFFEYQNILEVSHYLTTEFPEVFQQTTKEYFPPNSNRKQPKESYQNNLLIEKNNQIPKSNISSLDYHHKQASNGYIKNGQHLPQKEPIAIIGMEGIFPHAKNKEQFWQNLLQEQDYIEDIPEERRRYLNPNGIIKNKAAFIADVDKFDAKFFNISPREAELIDPQLRLLLQVIYGTLEDAGVINEIRGTNTGMFVGVSSSDYAQLIKESNQKVDAYGGVGNLYSILANRPSYYFDWKGPSLAIDTTCSSSLVALHTAVKAIENQECDQAVVAGVNLLLSPYYFEVLNDSGALSPTSESLSFDENANGYVRGESVATILLKPLNKAIKDKNQIYGVIRGSAVSHAGSTSSITAPSVDGEAQAIIKAWKNSNIHPNSLSYIEAHGTGTKLGDPIEMEALKKAFNSFSTSKSHTSPIYIGSAKAHIGHTEGAAGIVGVIKTLLSLKKGILPRMPKFKKLNPYIQLENSPFKINQEVVKWGPEKTLRRAGVSSFGIGGTYAHVVVEGYNKKTKPFTTNQSAIIILSAKNIKRLDEKVSDLNNFIHLNNSINIHDIAYTLQMSREPMRERLAFEAKNTEELKIRLKDYLNNQVKIFFSGNSKKEEIDFLFEGKAGNAYIQYAIKQQDYSSIAQLWVKGVNINWSLIYPKNNKPKKISLPTYPFEKKEYWFLEDIPSSTRKNLSQFEINNNILNKIHPSKPSKISSKNHLGLYYQHTWKKKNISSNTYASKKTSQTIIIGKNSLFCQQLKNALESTNHKVSIASNLASISSKVTDIHLIAGIQELNQTSTIKQQIELQEYTVFKLVKSLLKLNQFAKKLNLTVLTQNTQSVLPTDKVQAKGAGIIGLIGSLAKEIPHWKIRVIDIDHLNDSVATLLIKLPFRANGVLQALRNGNLYYPSLIPLKGLRKEVNKLRPHGVYVILGGAGGLGQITTEYLIKNYEAKVYWLGRRKVNPDIQQSIKTLSKLGPAPVYIQCDANDPLSIGAAYEQINLQEENINGLFHSAIVLKDKAIMKMDLSEFRKAFDIKTIATNYFLNTFIKENLDFICFYSSAISHLHLAGQSNYSAGCTYKDSLAVQFEQNYDIPCYIMNWGYWGEIGIVKDSDYQNRMLKNGIGSIDKEEGMKSLELLLGGSNRQITTIKLLNPLDEASTIFRFDKNIFHINSKSKLKLANLKLSSLTLEQEAKEGFDKICQKGILQVLIKMGFVGGAERITIQKLPIISKYQQWFDKIIDDLKKCGHLESNRNGQLHIVKTVKNALRDFSLTKELNKIVKRYPDIKAKANLLKVCISASEAVLTGKVLATEILFPNGNMELVEEVYKADKQVDYYNKTLCELIKKSITESIYKLEKGEKFSILEVGAGTGGTSILLFEALEPFKNQIRYVYTDISKSFLFHAEKHFKEKAPYLETKLFNIENSPTIQNISTGNFDLVIGTNVIHATKNIGNSLQNIKAVLKKNGILALNEIAQSEIFATLTFGLLDGWWLFEDSEIRLEGNPGLSSKNWEKVLVENGFEEVTILPEDKNKSQQIISSKSNGIITVQREQDFSELNSKKKINKNNPNIILPLDTQDDINQYLHTSLIKIASEILKMDNSEINIMDNFAEFGLDSILIIKFANEVNNYLDLDILPTDFLNYPTIEGLTKYILKEFEEGIQKRFHMLKTDKIGVEPVLVTKNNLPSEPFEGNKNKIEISTNSENSTGFLSSSFNKIIGFFKLKEPLDN